jgi:hypothetical protein
MLRNITESPHFDVVTPHTPIELETCFLRAKPLRKFVICLPVRDISVMKMYDIYPSHLGRRIDIDQLLEDSQIHGLEGLPTSRAMHFTSPNLQKLGARRLRVSTPLK